jgi:hypothetical protein
MNNSIYFIGKLVACQLSVLLKIPHPAAISRVDMTVNFSEKKAGYPLFAVNVLGFS